MLLLLPWRSPRAGGDDDDAAPAEPVYRTHPSCELALDLAEEAITERVPDVLSAALFVMEAPYNAAVDDEAARQIEAAKAWLEQNQDDWLDASDECVSYAD